MDLSLDSGRAGRPAIIIFFSFFCKGLIFDSKKANAYLFSEGRGGGKAKANKPTSLREALCCVWCRPAKLSFFLPEWQPLGWSSLEVDCSCADRDWG